MLNKHQKKIRFLFVGGFNTLIGLAAFPLLYFLLENKMHYMVLLVIAQVLCILSAYITNKWLVFRTKGNYIKELIKFSSFYMVFFAVNIVVVPVLVEGFEFHPVISQVFVSIGVIISSFYWHQNVTFAENKYID